MRNIVRTLAIVTAFVVIAASQPAAQGSAVRDEARKDWVAMKDTMMKIANEMPEDKFTYKSTPPQRNYGEQILHVATVNVNFLELLGGKTKAPVIDAKATSKADILKAMADSFDYGTALIDEQTPESMLQTVPARFMGPSTRSRVLYFLMSHAQDIYGQMVVYLRLNGGVPPRSQRP
ncbi:MAG: DinB family protein [Acidobacteria bacterium]|nr:DinB family protein [Acidobacteriota bacterium]